MRRWITALRERKFARDTLVLQVATFVQAGSYLLTSVLTKRYLGMHEMGRWSSARDMFSMAYLFVTMGLVSAAVTRYAEGMGRGDRRACVQALAAMTKIGLAAAVLVTGAAFLLAPLIAEHAYRDRQVGQFAAILCAAGMFEIVRNLTVVALQGTRQMREYSLFDIVSSLARIGLVFGVLAAGLGVDGVVWAFVAHMTFAGGLALRFYGRARRGDPRLAPPPLAEVLAAVPGAHVGDLFGISYLMALNKGINILLPLAGGLLIPGMAALQTSGEAFKTGAAYKIGYVLSWGLGLAMTGVTQALLPALGLKIGAEAPVDRLGHLFKKVSLTAGFLMIGMTILSLPVMYLVVTVLYGAGAEDSFLYYVVLTAGNLFIGFNTVIDSFYIYTRRLKFAVAANCGLGLLGLMAIYAGGRLYGPIGVTGAVALCDALGLFHLVYMWRYFRLARAREAPGPDTVDLTS